MAEACVTALIFRLTDLYTAYAGDYKGTETYGKREEGVLRLAFIFSKKLLTMSSRNICLFSVFVLFPIHPRKYIRLKVMRTYAAKNIMFIILYGMRSPCA